MRFLDKNSINLMYREILIMFVFLCGIFYMLHAILNSNLNVHTISGISISYHYIFPLVISLICFSLLFYKFITIYKKVIINMKSSDHGMIFNNLGFNKDLKEFLIFIDTVNKVKAWSYWEGFSKKHITYMIIEEKNGNKFIIPYKECDKDLLIQFLIENGGNLIEKN